MDPGQSTGREPRGRSPDGKRFSVFENGLDGSPLHYFVKRMIALVDFQS